jgi:molybdopterin/thiamine biosynthesis adenylyltransferase
MKHEHKSEYVIPGMEDVGIPGYRKSPNTKKMEEIIDIYTGGNGAVINHHGMMLAPEEANNTSPANVSHLKNVVTSMANHTKNPYLEPNSRRDALIPDLSAAHITIIGLGGGAPIPVELAKCGIKNFSLFDHDTLDRENLIRHPCGIEEIGKMKVDAISQYMNKKSGGQLSISAYAEDIFTSTHLRSEIAKSDLVIVATDTEASRFFINEICQEKGIPAIFVGMFEDGMGGEIFAFEPKQGCYCCLAEHLGRKQFIESYARATRKGDCSSKRDTSAMPGLGIDQGILCHIAARKALDILLKHKKHRLRPVGKNWIVFSICGIENILSETLTSIQMDIHKHSSCMTCNVTAYE